MSRWVIAVMTIEAFALGGACGALVQKRTTEDVRGLDSQTTCVILQSHQPDGRAAWLTWRDGVWRRTRDGNWYYDTSERAKR